MSPAGRPRVSIRRARPEAEHSNETVLDLKSVRVDAPGAGAGGAGLPPVAARASGVLMWGGVDDGVALLRGDGLTKDADLPYLSGRSGRLPQ